MSAAQFGLIAALAFIGLFVWGVFLLASDPWPTWKIVLAWVLMAPFILFVAAMLVSCFVVLWVTLA